MRVEIPTVGTIEFPDGMSDTDIAAAIQSNYPHLSKQGGAQNAAPAESVDTSTGAPFMQRVMASFPKSNEGKIAYLEGKYGKGRVKEINGEIAYMNPKTMKWTQFNPQGMDLGDIGGLAGGAVEMAPAVAGGIMGAPSGPGAIATTAAGAAAGTSLRNAIGQAVSGGRGLSTTEAITDPLISGAVGGAFEGGLQGAKALWNMPGKFAAKTLTAGADTPYAQTGRKLSEQTGIRLTPAQLSGDPEALAYESGLRRLPTRESAKKIIDYDKKQAAEAIGRLNSIIKKTGGGKATPEMMGNVLSKSYDDVVSKLEGVRRSMANADFGIAEQAAAGKPIVDTTNYREAALNLLDELNVPGSPTGPEGVSMVKKTISELTEGYKNFGRGPEGGAPYTVKQAQTVLHNISAELKGATGNQRRILSILKDGLEKDLDAAASNPKFGQAADALKMARENYRINSQQLNALQESTLGNLIGKGDKSPEAIANALFSKHPSEVRTIVKIVKEQNPEVLNTIRAGMLGQGLDQAIQRNAAASVNAPILNMKAWNTWYLKNYKNLKEVVEPDTLKEMSKTFATLKRASDTSGMMGSPTTPLGMIFNTIESVAARDVKGIARGVAVRSVAEKMADVMTQPGGARAIRVMARAKPGTRDYVKAAALIGTLAAKNQAMEGMQ